MKHCEEMIAVIAEQLKNEFPGSSDYVDKARRLYAIMKLEKSLDEIQVERIRKELEKMSE